MGLIAKSMTKRKVAPESAPDNVVADSALQRSLLSAARVRAAMLGRDLGGVSSQTRRGSVSSFAFGTASCFWFDRVSDEAWRVTLGTLNNANQRVVDWALAIASGADNRIEVTTPAYLTNNDELVNPRVYDAVRTGVLDTFAYQSLPDDGEAELTERSLTSTVPARSLISDPVSPGPIRIRVAGSIDAVRGALARIGLPCTAPTSDELEWRLGLGDGRIRLSLATAQASTVLEGALVFDETGPYRRACAEEGARAWRRRGQMFLQEVDPETQLEWSETP